MATGYTSYILEDKLKRPEDFALLCARAFGAAINQRDDSLDVPIKIPEIDTKYEDDAIKRAEREYKRLKKFTKEQQFKFGAKIINKQIKSYKKYIKEKLVNKAKLEKMLNWAVKWTPPTTEHEGLKKFMVNQITETIKFDGDAEYYYNQLDMAEKEKPVKIYKQLLKSAKEDIGYYKKRKRETIKSETARADWIKALINSL